MPISVRDWLALFPPFHETSHRPHRARHIPQSNHFIHGQAPVHRPVTVQGKNSDRLRLPILVAVSRPWQIDVTVSVRIFGGNQRLSFPNRCPFETDFIQLGSPESHVSRVLLGIKQPLPPNPTSQLPYHRRWPPSILPIIFHQFIKIVLPRRRPVRAFHRPREPYAVQSRYPFGVQNSALVAGRIFRLHILSTGVCPLQS
mmetsp:Transcript_39076/g.83428  ORF Transcript_39076/g.83428 Transcript_39076/m.83428 type:complete len:200 (-) Transcript_39076:1158-1757(-)